MKASLKLLLQRNLINLRPESYPLVQGNLEVLREEGAVLGLKLCVVGRS